MSADANTPYLARLPPDQAALLREALDKGWRIETDWRKIRERYRDLDLANDVPRTIIYLDLGVLIGRLETYEAFLCELGYRAKETDDAEEADPV